MKKLLLGLCLTALGVACRASGANMHDSSCTGADCADCKTGCTEMPKDAACTGEGECSGEAKVCPVTGKTMN